MLHSTQGVVWLVGAGPGDPGLITVKGQRCIREADAVVYDFLVNPEFLKEARSDAELICAGKRAGHHAMSQEETNALLVKLGLQGKKVCRLKGGDPFVFGRGGEEALALQDAGVAYEIVPGISSSIAAPAYAGIPVTHRGVATSFRVITGHEDPTKPESQLDWDEIARCGGTLVFLMGVKNLPLIVEALLSRERDPETPVALVQEGATPLQRTVLGTLSTIVDMVEEAGIRPPAVIVVGEVAALRDSLSWYEKTPLFGRRIVVTRSRAQASTFAELLEAAGAAVVQAPVIKIESLADSPEMRAMVRNSGKMDWVVFTSTNAVDAFFASVRGEGLDVRVLNNTRIAAVGSATEARLNMYGITADLAPALFVGKALLERLLEEDVVGKSFLFPSSEIAARTLPEGLKEAGAEVVEVVAYRNVATKEIPADLPSLMLKDEVDLVTFTSSSTVRNFLAALPEENRTDLKAHLRAASIGPATSKSLREAGIEPVLEAQQSTIPDFNESILQFLSNEVKA